MQLLSDFYGITINEILSGERLNEEQYRQKAEENIKSALDSSAFTLDEKISYYKNKWKEDHLFECIFARGMIWVLLVVGILAQEVIWAIAFAIASVVYYVVKRNRMMTYVEEHAFDGSGRQ